MSPKRSLPRAIGFAASMTVTLACASETRPANGPAGAVDQHGQAVVPAPPDLDKPVSTTLRKINRMLTNAYNKGYAAGLEAAAQAEGSQDDIRDLLKQASPRQGP